MFYRLLLIINLLIPCLLAAENLTSNPGMSANIKVEGFYYAGQTTKGKQIKVERSGFQIEKEFTDDKRLFDGKKDGSVISTFFWGHQIKRIIAVIDIGCNSQLDEVKVTIPRGNKDGNYADTCTVFVSSAGVAEDQWTQAALVKNQYKSSKEAPAQYDFVVKLPPDTRGRFVKIVMYSKISPLMQISEIEIFGKHLEKRELPIPTAWRFEPETVKGTVVQQFSNRLGSAIWVKRNVFDIGLPVTDSQKISIWVSYLDNGGRTLEVNCNDLDKIFPEQIPAKYWRWEKLGETVGCKFNLKMYAINKNPPAVDSIIFSADPEFDPNNSPKEVLQNIPTVPVILGFADKLYKNSPDIEPGEFARKIAEFYQFPSKKTKRFINENGAILWNDKAVFPIAFYHVQQNDSRVPTTINSFIGGSVERKSDDKRCYSSIITYHAMWFAYDAIVRKIKPIADNSNIIMHYICDEPENVGVSAKDLQRIHALVRALDPAHPTFVNVSAGTAGNRALMTVSDFVGVDHYPVPNGRLYDIGYSVDMARVNSDGRPVIFVAQTFDWGGYGFANSRFPTPDEISVMCFLPIIHGCRGLWLYEFPAPKMDSKTYIKDMHPQAWTRIEKILDTISRIEPELTGPEAEFPGKIKVSAPPNRPLSSRFAINADRSTAVLVICNAWKNNAEMTLEWNSPEVILEPLFCHGVDINGKNLKFSGYGSGVFRVKGIDLKKIRTLNTSEALSLSAKRLEKIIGRPEITVSVADTPDWNKAIDLLDSWQSSNRFDQAKMIAAPDGLHIKVVQRFRKDAVARISKRDGAVWSDPSIELFFGKLNSRSFCQLQINVINTQADLKVNMDSAEMFDSSVNFQWFSKVIKGMETAEYTIVIPWKTLRDMTETVSGETIGFNLASTHSNADWAGLSGGSYINPGRFGIVNFGDKTK